MGLIVPSGSRVAENVAPQERHFAKHLSSDSDLGIPLPVTLGFRDNGDWDSRDKWSGLVAPAVSRVSPAPSKPADNDGFQTERLLNSIRIVPVCTT